MQPNGSQLVQTPLMEPLSLRFHLAHLMSPESLRQPLMPQRFATGPQARMPAPVVAAPTVKRKGR